MALIYTALLLAVGLVGVNANCKYEPNCTSCSYYNGIGFVPHPDFCYIYYVCYRNLIADRDSDYGYKWKLMCCDHGLKWDEEHLTCTWGHNCEEPESLYRYCCPDIPKTTDLPCPEEPHPDDPTKFRNKVTWQERMCPYGTIWNQEQCTCVVGGDYKQKEPCHKLLSFEFSDTYDSYSCYNFAKGEPYGYPTIVNSSLLLNGVDQFLTVNFLNNWFTWNPKAKTFTACVWIYPLDVEGIFAILSTNCYTSAGADSVLEMYMNRSVLFVEAFGNSWHNQSNELHVDRWTKHCVTFDHGQYTFYYNGVEAGSLYVGTDWDVVSHSATTLGYNENFKIAPFNGYIDDFCFWHQVLSAKEIYDCYKKGPSNTIINTNP